MATVDHAYYMRRAEQERSLVERAGTPEAKVVHQQLCDLYLAQADCSLDGFDTPAPVHAYE